MALEAQDTAAFEAFAQAIYSRSESPDGFPDHPAGYYLMGSDVGLTEDEYIFKALLDFDKPDLSKWDVEEWIRIDEKVSRRFMPLSVWVTEVALACGYSIDKKSARGVARRVIQISYDDEIEKLSQSSID